MRGANDTQNQDTASMRGARNLKESAQRLIGAGIVVMLAAKLALALVLGFYRPIAEPGQIFPPDWPPICEWLVLRPTLALVGDALMFSAGLDLAYMLFTPQLDEAVGPLMLGAAAAGLMVASGDDLGLKQAGAVLIFACVVGGLLYLRELFELE